MFAMNWSTREWDWQQSWPGSSATCNKRAWYHSNVLVILYRNLHYLPSIGSFIAHWSETPANELLGVYVNRFSWVPSAVLTLSWSINDNNSKTKQIAKEWLLTIPKETMERKLQVQSNALAKSVERLTAMREVKGSIPEAGPILRVLK